MPPTKEELKAAAEAKRQANLFPKLNPPPSPKPAVRILLAGLRSGPANGSTKLYKAGEIETDPSARLLELAQPNTLHLGRQVAELVSDPTPAPSVDPSNQPEPTE